MMAWRTKGKGRNAQHYQMQPRVVHHININADRQRQAALQQEAQRRAMEIQQREAQQRQIALQQQQEAQKRAAQQAAPQTKR